MLVIRLARTGKKHQAYFRVVVADSRKAPGAKFVEIVGNYDPHLKNLTLKKERLDFYISHGAQPSNTVAKLLSKEKIELPKWVKITEKKKAPKKTEEEKPALENRDKVSAQPEAIQSLSEEKEESKTESMEVVTPGIEEKKEIKEGAKEEASIEDKPAE